MPNGFTELKDFKSEWNAVWKLTDGLKVGVTTDYIVPDIATRLRSLEGQVTTYQLAVAAYNKAISTTPPGEVSELKVKLVEVFGAIEGLEAGLQVAIDMQIGANENVQSGALQMPDTTPKAVYNPALEDLSKQIAATVSAMGVDLAAAGIATEPSEEQETLREGTGEKVEVTEKNYEAPDWMKFD